MNITEQVVEVYYTFCKNCFTFSDVKIKDGEGRQIDLLAYDIENKIIYHIESSISITHDKF